MNEMTKFQRELFLGKYNGRIILYSRQMGKTWVREAWKKLGSTATAPVKPQVKGKK